MSKDSLAEALRALAADDRNRSETARLRDVLDDVEAVLQAGVSRSAILETLNTQGFAMTLKSFESALYRLRKQRMAVGQARGSSGSAGAPVVEAAVSPPVAVAVASISSDPRKIQNPADLRAARRIPIDLDDYSTPDKDSP